jgi:hypothetical protein
MLEPEVIVNLLPELLVGMDPMMRSRWPGETFVDGIGWSVQLASFVSALGSETNEFHNPLSIFWQRLTSARYPNQKAARVAENRAAFLGDIPGRSDSIDYDAINHTQIAHVCVINTHVRAGFDRGSDHFARFVHNVTRPFENISARNI